MKVGGDVLTKVRQSLELELPACSFDDEVVEYMVGALEDTTETCADILVDAWFPFLLSAGACKDEEEGLAICHRLLERLRREPELESAKEGLPKDVEAWLRDLALTQYAKQAQAWCERLHVLSLDQLLENSESFVIELRLKPLEKRRVEKAASNRSALPKSTTRRPGYFGPPEDPERYQLLEEIGAGATATVHKCLRGTKMFAVKIISLVKFRFQNDFQRFLDRLQREVSNLLALQHPRIVKLYDVIEEADEALCLVMELVEGGELFDRITHCGEFPETLARHVFIQIVEGLRYIHSKDIIHRDLKPENILVSEHSSTGQLLEIKLSDFGHSKLINDGYNTTMSSRVGTPQYWAPEVSDPRQAAKGYDHTVDLFSLGVVLYVMLAGAYPFGAGSQPSFRCQSSGQELSEPAKDLIRSLINVNPKDRLPLERCLEHPWVALTRSTIRNELALPKGSEARIMLPTLPSKDQVKMLRRDLAKWQARFCFSAEVKRQELVVNYRDTQVDQRNVAAARQDLLRIIELHIGRPFDC